MSRLRQSQGLIVGWGISNIYIPWGIYTPSHNIIIESSVNDFKSVTAQAIEY